MKIIATHKSHDLLLPPNPEEVEGRVVK